MCCAMISTISPRDAVDPVAQPTSGRPGSNPRQPEPDVSRWCRCPLTGTAQRARPARGRGGVTAPAQGGWADRVLRSQWQAVDLVQRRRLRADHGSFGGRAGHSGGHRPALAEGGSRSLRYRTTTTPPRARSSRLTRTAGPRSGPSSTAHGGKASATPESSRVLTLERSPSPSTSGTGRPR